MVKKFRKKPVVIEALHLTPDLPFVDLANFIGKDIEVHHTFVTIPTLEGDMKATVGDWIIKGVQGECYPCKPDIFEATYEEV